MNDHDDEEEDTPLWRIGPETSVWRLDPESSFSDWTIKVVQENNSEGIHKKDENDTENDTDNHNINPNNGPRDALNGVESLDAPLESVYHVHRVYLASGSRKSEYFQGLFSLPTHTEEGLSRTTEFAFPESACAVFPIFLDYLYDAYPEILLMDTFTDRASSGDTRACREVVGLAFLADYLGVPKLASLLKDQIEAMLDPRTIHILCREALLYQMDWIVDECVRIAAESPLDLVRSSSNKGRAQSPASSTSTTNSSPLVEALSGDDMEEEEDKALPPALETMQLLPLEKQNELLKLSLTNAVNELRRFKRVPSHWKDNVDDTCATHMPNILAASAAPTTQDFYRFSRQGCGLPFRNKICPLFYFDRDLPPRAAMTTTTTDEDSLLEV